ncbi:hypothetical protein [Salinispira pacifica]
MKRVLTQSGSAEKRSSAPQQPEQAPGPRAPESGGAESRSPARTAPSTAGPLTKKAPEQKIKPSPAPEAQKKAVPVGPEAEVVRSEPATVGFEQQRSGQPLHPEMVTRMVLRELGEIPVTIESAAHLFAMLKRNLLLRKAALLLPDPEESMFVPWSITGFDITTQRRLHIPEETAYTLFSNRVPLMLLFEGDEMRPLEPYFSVREFSALKRLVFCSFFYEARLLAILVIADTPFFGLDPTILQVMYSAFEEGISSLLFRSREERIARIQLPLLFAFDQLSPMAHEALNQAGKGDASILFMEVDPEPAVVRILERTRETDRYRVRQDVLRILNTLLAGLGKVFTLPRHRLLLMRTELDGDTGQLDVDLLSHQLNERLKRFFSELTDGDDAVTCRVVEYPTDSADLEELTASFS